MFGDDIARGVMRGLEASGLHEHLQARDKRIAELEAFEKSIRHAAQLFDDGFANWGETQVREAVRHLDKLRGK